MQSQYFQTIIDTINPNPEIEDVLVIVFNEAIWSVSLFSMQLG